MTTFRMIYFLCILSLLTIFFNRIAKRYVVIVKTGERKEGFLRRITENDEESKKDAPTKIGSVLLFALIKKTYLRRASAVREEGRWNSGGFLGGCF